MTRTRMVASCAAVLALAWVAAGCGGDGVHAGVARASSGSNAAMCPRAWRAGWQQLANRVRAPVYCPSWMPNPLDAKIGGSAYGGTFVERDRDYLVSFIVSDVVGSQNTEVHVNFRGYPGRTSIPMCQDTVTMPGKVLHPRIPCFSDPGGTRQLGDKTVTVYTVNQGADQWHVLYAWRHRGALYAVSEHVIVPYTYRKVVQNLDRLVRGLVLLQPAAR